MVNRCYQTYLWFLPLEASMIPVNLLAGRTIEWGHIWRIPGQIPGKTLTQNLAGRHPSSPVGTTYLTPVNSIHASFDAWSWQPRTWYIQTYIYIYIYIFFFSNLNFHMKGTLHLLDSGLGGFCKAPEASQCIHQTLGFWAQFRHLLQPASWCHGWCFCLKVCCLHVDDEAILGFWGGLSEGLITFWRCCGWWNSQMIGTVDEKVRLHSWYGTFFIFKKGFMMFLYLDRCNIFADQ